MVNKGVPQIVGTIVFLVIGSLVLTSEGAICNEAVCASVVSKCMLTQSCKCDLATHCTCCKDCINCLSYLYSECCSCVDMCPGDSGPTAALNPLSYVGEFPDGVPGLFQALTEDPDSLNRWNTYTIPVMPTSDVSLQNVDDPVKQNTITNNCTVAYMSQCMQLNKCKNSCQSMGSSGFRWFHDYCCECVGDTCTNFGLDESRCSKCGKGMERSDENIPDDLDSETSQDEFDYGEEMDTRDPESYDL